MSRSTLIKRFPHTVDETRRTAAVDEPALAIIDDALMSFAGRSLVTGDEVVDRLLDLRNAFVAATLLRDLEPTDLCSS
jgi:hypothetical protein